MSAFGPTPRRAGFRRVLTPLGMSRKRKDRDAPLDVPPLAAEATAAASSRPPMPKPKSEPAKPKPADSSSAMVLAGYLAHEFLTRGSLFGRCLDPTATARWEEEEEVEEENAGKGMAGRTTAACAEMAGRLVMGESGARLPGIVNPTQLARWLQTKP